MGLLGLWFRDTPRWQRRNVWTPFGCGFGVNHDSNADMCVWPSPGFGVVAITIPKSKCIGPRSAFGLVINHVSSVERSGASFCGGFVLGVFRRWFHDKSRFQRQNLLGLLRLFGFVINHDPKVELFGFLSVVVS